MTDDRGPRARGGPVRLPARLRDPIRADVPVGVRVSFGWSSFVLDSRPVALVVDEPVDGAAALRVANALDLRDRAVVEVASAAGGEQYGTIDLSFAVATQVGELELPSAALDDVRRDGLRLRRIEGEAPVHILAPGGAADPFVPHLLVPHAAPAEERLRAALRDPDETLTQFGWMAGCVMDALLDLGLPEVLETQLDRYFDDSGPVWEDFSSRPRDGEVTGTETTSMYATLALRRPDHAAVDRVLDFFARRTDEYGVIGDGAVVAEHNYTVAYPLAAIGRARGRDDLLEVAARQLRARRDALWHDGALWLRRFPDGRRTYRAWSRGVAWYLLGAARTLRLLGADAAFDDLRDDLVDRCRWALALQRPDGLWGSYLEDRSTVVETSGSAGIATGDGLVAGMSVSNKAEAGEDMQRSDHRVIGACATGLAGQLLAALR